METNKLTVQLKNDYKFVYEDNRPVIYKKMVDSFNNAYYDIISDYQTIKDTDLLNLLVRLYNTNES